MTTQTNTQTGEGIPEFLRRTDSPAAKIAAKHNATVKATPAPASKPAPKAKTPKVVKATKAVKQAQQQPQAKARASKPAAKARPVHVPANITSTPDNPSKSIVPTRFKEAYKAHGGTNGDNVAMALKSAVTVRNKDGRETTDWGVLRQIAEANGIDMDVYDKLNNGQKRMNVGNKLRGMIKAGQTVVVGKTRIATLRAAA